MNAKVIASVALVGLLFGVGTTTYSQPGAAPLPPADTELGRLEPVSSSTPMTPAMEAERAKIWNSPAMLRARAWTHEYCERSAKITPEEAKDYMTELQRMTPTQMKLWLLKFNHEEEMIQQRQAAFEMSRRASVQQAMGIDRSMQQAYGRINKDETAAAQTEQKSINEQTANEQAGDQAKRESMNPWNFDNYELGVAGGLNYLDYPPAGFVPNAPAHYHYHFHR